MISKSIHAPGAPPRRCGDPGWDRDGTPFSEINDGLETLPKEYLIRGWGRRG